MWKFEIRKWDYCWRLKHCWPPRNCTKNSQWQIGTEVGNHGLTLWLHLISVHEKTGNVSHLEALKDRRRWQWHGNSPNSCGIASHFDDVSRVSCCSETLKGHLCFLLNLSPSVCLPLLFSHSFFCPLSEGFLLERDQFWLRHWLPFGKKPHHCRHPVLYVVTNYSPPPFLRPPCNSIFPWNQRDHRRQTHGCR